LPTLEIKGVYEKHYQRVALTIYKRRYLCAFWLTEKPHFSYAVLDLQAPNKEEGSEWSWKEVRLTLTGKVPKFMLDLTHKLNCCNLNYLDCRCDTYNMMCIGISPSYLDNKDMQKVLVVGGFKGDEDLAEDIKQTQQFKIVDLGSNTI